MDTYIYRVDVTLYDEDEGREETTSCFIPATGIVAAVDCAVDYFGEENVTGITCEALDFSVLHVPKNIGDIIADNIGKY